MGEKRNAYRLLVGRPEGRRPLGRPRFRWMDLGEIGLGGVDWIGLAQVRDNWSAVVNAVMNLRFHKMLVNYRVASQTMASRVGLSSIGVVSSGIRRTIYHATALNHHFLGFV
jgi:hypothetical protein